MIGPVSFFPYELFWFFFGFHMVVVEDDTRGLAWQKETRVGGGAFGKAPWAAADGVFGRLTRDNYTVARRGFTRPTRGQGTGVRVKQFRPQGEPRLFHKTCNQSRQFLRDNSPQ